MPSWISEQNNLSNSESLCCSDASHKVSAQSDMVLEEISFEEFQDSRRGYRNGSILAILYLSVALMPPITFRLNLTLEEISFEKFQDGGHLGYRNGTILAILNL